MRKTIDINLIKPDTLYEPEGHLFMSHDSMCNICGSSLCTDRGYWYAVRPKLISRIGFAHLMCCERCMPTIEQRRIRHRNSNV